MINCEARANLFLASISGHLCSVQAADRLWATDDGQLVDRWSRTTWTQKREVQGQGEFQIREIRVHKTCAAINIEERLSFDFVRVAISSVWDGSLVWWFLTPFFVETATSRRVSSCGQTREGHEYERRDQMVCNSCEVRSRSVGQALNAELR